jgi:hypothetical protein
MKRNELVRGECGKASVVGFYFTMLIAILLVLGVVWPTIDARLNTESTYSSVSAEAFNVSGNSDTWMALANNDITVNSESVYNGTYNAVRNTDYEMNFTDGKIKPLSTGDLNFNATAASTEYSIDYDHSSYTPLANISSSTRTLINLFGMVLALGLLIMMLKPII